MRICKTTINVGPDIGTETQTDSRICKSVIGVGPDQTSGILISYGDSGVISYGTSGPIIY